MRYSGGKFSLRVANEVNRPDVPTPLGLGVVAVLCIAWFAALLVFVVAAQLSPSRFEPVPAAEALFWVAFGALTPILISHSIATNHRSSRWLISLTALATTGLLFVHLDVSRQTHAEQLTFCAVAIALLVWLHWWLFVSQRMRVYYALIGNRPLPADVDAGIALISHREWQIAKALEALSPYLEALGALLILFAVAYGLWQTM